MNNKLFYPVTILILMLFLASCVTKTSSTATNSTSVGQTTVIADDQKYLPAKPQFEFGFGDSSKSFPSTNGARYVSQDTGKYMGQYPNGTFYHFELVDTGMRVDLSVPSGVAEDLKTLLVPGTVYRIDIQILPGWPFAYGLLITHDSTLDFLGVAEGNLSNRHITIESTLPVSFSLNIVLSNVLTDRYIENVGQFTRLTNDEIKFSLGDSSVILHQGESSMLGSYKIDLLVAQEQVYKPYIYDAGTNAFSYTIARIK